MRRVLAAGLATVFLLGSCGGDEDRLLVAAGTTLDDSGVLHEIVARYEATGVDVDISVIGEATARVLELGRRGGADLLFTHAPAAEVTFIAEGRARRVEPVFVSEFVLVGPPDALSSFPDRTAAGALREIAELGLTFVSRADGSGTHAKEQELWSRAGVDPTGARWYLETGQGMGLTLQVADQRRGFTLAEVGTYLAAAPNLSIEIQAVTGPARDLENPYRALVVTGGDESAATAFVEWLLSASGRQAIVDANEALFGRVVYAPTE